MRYLDVFMLRPMCTKCCSNISQKILDPIGGFYFHMTGSLSTRSRIDPFSNEIVLVLVLGWARAILEQVQHHYQGPRIEHQGLDLSSAAFQCYSLNLASLAAILSNPGLLSFHIIVLKCQHGSNFSL